MQYAVPYYTTIAAAKAAVRAIESVRSGRLTVRPLQDYHGTNSTKNAEGRSNGPGREKEQAAADR